MSTVKWNLDPSHSEIGFKVKHLMITNVSGAFEKFNVKAETEGGNFSSAKIEFTAEAGSVNTGDEQRDKHLKSADFFDAENHPELKFVSTGLEKKSDEEYVLNGNLTIRGTSHPVKLKAEFGGIGKDPWGNEKAGFSLSGKLNRKDFNLNWNAALEAGGVLVSDEVRLYAEIQLVKAA
ncbi:MAG: YceI family protein [Crocinitomicaceae bacterium]|nr:YceI family protein [Crocinitomicaceae bacterium]